MEIRNTLPEDMDRVMFIFEQAKQFMRLNGNLHQWTGGYPSEEVLEADISSNSSFVCVDDQKEVVGTFCFRYGFSPEPTYNVIYDGGWLNEKPYGGLHLREKWEGSFPLAWNGVLDTSIIFVSILIGIIG